MSRHDPDKFDYRAYCAEMEARISAGEHLKKAGDEFYYYWTPSAIPGEGK